MIELFTIFTKGGIVLWCFQESGQFFKESIDRFIRDVLIQERVHESFFKHNNITIKYKLDNEFELVFLIVYQSAIQLSYSDQLLTDVHKKFRDMYKNVLSRKEIFFVSMPKKFAGFTDCFEKMYYEYRTTKAVKPEKIMRTFEESEKSKKTVASMIGKQAERPIVKQKVKEETPKSEKPKVEEKVLPTANKNSSPTIEKKVNEKTEIVHDSPKSDAENDEMRRKREEFFKKKGGKKPAEPEKQKGAEKKTKQARTWGLSSQTNTKDMKALDYSENVENAVNGGEKQEERNFFEQQKFYIGQMKGELPGFDEYNDTNSVAADDDSEDIIEENTTGWFAAFKSLVGNKKLTAEDIEPVLEKMKENLLAKNVASAPADKICHSVFAKLEGKVVGSFSRVASIVKEAFRESLVQLLTPKRRVDILRDVIEAKNEHRPYVIVFCGVNGVGKSTNLAKITFWLNENGHRVLIAAGDTFRAGAVEQLRTHTKHLNALHPNSVQLYEQGYGKDPAGLAAAAIGIAVERNIDVVLVDTAGRMQDNEPLMRSLVKLIRVNEPDLVLFVGEALVGNEAVDQLVKFNQALADYSSVSSENRMIDGIVLTKFDTIDDKVGAAISMTFITGQPIVFVGTGQTYRDLKNLNANAVVHALLK